MSALRKLTIDRSRWIRGEGYYDSFLLRPRDGHMCCLGFFARELGACESHVFGAGRPIDVPVAFHDAPWLFQLRGGEMEHSADGRFLINVNDDKDLDDAQRERRISQVFVSHGWEIEFVDGPVTP